MSRSTLSCLVVLLAAAGGLRGEDPPRVQGPRQEALLNSLPLRLFVETVSLDHLANLVVTEAKVPQPAETATQRIHVLTAGDLDQLTPGNRNVAETGLYNPGQFVNVLSRNDANWGSFGGLGPKYNGYLLDGLPIDAFVDPMSLDSWMIERVEFHEGPASVLYPTYLNMDFAGNEAPLAGTTNFILRERVDEPSTRARIEGGS